MLAKLKDEQAWYISEGAGHGSESGVAEIALRKYPEPETASLVKFLRAFSSDPVSETLYPEWFKAAQIVLVMVSGSVADERMCWAMKWIKDKRGNKLEKHLETCVLLHQPTGSFQLFDQETCPYDKAVEKRFPTKKPYLF